MEFTSHQQYNFIYYYVITGGPQLEVNQVIVLNEKWPAPAFSAGVVRYFVGTACIAITASI